MNKTMLLGIAVLCTLTAEAAPADRTAWFREAKFGMFIHWGPYSLAGVEASWPIMRPTPGTITEPEYRQLYKRFNPVKFDPAAWVRLAKAAGQRYMVFTSKHHDGFCMFDSDYTDYKITRTPYGKDIVAELAAACKEAGMPLGFYYSPPDMNHPAFRDTSRPSAENWRGQPERPEWPLYLEYMRLQLSELLRRYGDVAVLWFDGLGEQRKYDGRRFHELIRTRQPATLVNNRIGPDGDFATPEQFIPKAIPTKNARTRLAGLEDSSTPAPSAVPAPAEFQPWETCMTINQTWAYNANDRDFKSSAQLIRMLVEVASKGGNFLLNVGPAPDGTIQPEFQERLLAIGEWLKANGEAIYGTTYGPVQNLPFGRMTAKPGRLYVHVFDWPSTGNLEVAGLKTGVVSARVLATGTTLRFQQQRGRLLLQVPVAAPDAAVTVLELATR